MNLWLGIIPTGCIALGTWQVYRLKWKVKLIETLNKVQSSPDVPEFILSEKNESPNNYCKYRIRGSWNDFKNGYALVGPRLFGRKFGYKLIYPFLLESGQFILIDVGWIPQDTAKKHISKFQLANRYQSDLDALSLPTERQFPLGQWLFIKRDGRNFTIRNCKKIAQLLQIPSQYENGPFLFQALPSTAEQGREFPRRTTIDPTQIPNRHLEYIITW